ncbi:MAG: hypothetical protein AAGE38_08680 [Pseudomonadota bacterium]
MTQIEPRAEDLPIRKSVRRLRWFLASFEEQVERTTTETGNQFEIDVGALSAVFVDWLRDFEAQKPTSDADRLPYVGFASGLMLRTLVSHKPVRLVSKPPGSDETNPAYFWPEGYLYVAYCLNVRALVIEQDFHEKQRLVPDLKMPRTWWSFKENAEEDPDLAIAFLDLFAGDVPQWEMPSIFRAQGNTRLAERFFTPIGPGKSTG